MRVVASSVILATALAGTASTARADDGSLVDLLGPREVAVGEAMRGGATGASSIGLNPAGLPLNHEFVFEGGYGYRPEDQASLVGISACDSTSAIPGCFYYNYADSEPGNGMSSTTHIAGLSVAYPLSKMLFVGSNVKYFHFDTNEMGQTSASGFNMDAGATLKFSEIANLGLAGYNLLGTASSEIPRAVGGGIYVHAASMISLSFDSRWKLDGSDHSARYGGGGELFIRSNNGQTGFPIRAGALHDSGLGVTYLSGGLGYSTMTFGLDVAARKGISGSDETLFIASMRFFGPRMTQGMGLNSSSSVE